MGENYIPQGIFIMLFTLKYFQELEKKTYGVIITVTVQFILLLFLHFNTVIST